MCVQCVSAPNKSTTISCVDAWSPNPSSTVDTVFGKFNSPFFVLFCFSFREIPVAFYTLPKDKKKKKKKKDKWEIKFVDNFWGESYKKKKNVIMKSRFFFFLGRNNLTIKSWRQGFFLIFYFNLVFINFFFLMPLFLFFIFVATDRKLRTRENWCETHVFFPLARSC